MKNRIIILSVSCFLLIQAIALTVIFLGANSGYTWVCTAGAGPVISIAKPNGNENRINEVAATYCDELAEEFGTGTGIRWHTAVMENTKKLVGLRITAFSISSGEIIVTRELWIDTSGKEPVIMKQ